MRDAWLWRGHDERWLCMRGGYVAAMMHEMCQLDVICMYASATMHAHSISEYLTSIGPCKITMSCIMHI